MSVSISNQLINKLLKETNTCEKSNTNIIERINARVWHNKHKEEIQGNICQTIGWKIVKLGKNSTEWLTRKSIRN